MSRNRRACRGRQRHRPPTGRPEHLLDLRARPFMPFLKSTGSAASRIRTPGGTAITPGLAPPQHPAQRRRVDIRADAHHRRAERDLHPARRLGRCRAVLRDHHRHEPRSFARCRCRELLAPDEELARVQPVAPRHRRDRASPGRGSRPRSRPSPRRSSAATGRPGDHLDAAEAVVVRTGDTTIITHRSRTRASRLGPFILVAASRPAR